MSFDSVTLPLHLTQSQLFLAPTVPLYTVPDLDREALGYSNAPPSRLEEDGCVFINFNKGEDDEGCLKFCNILNGVELCKENY